MPDTVNGPEGGLEWDAVNWRACERNVGRLRQRIFTAARDGDWPTVRNLPGRVPAIRIRVRRPPVWPCRRYRYSAPGVATTL
jgi:hypothetical protein